MVMPIRPMKLKKELLKKCENSETNYCRPGQKENTRGWLKNMTGVLEHGARVKKLSWKTRLGDASIEEQVYQTKNNGEQLRPFQCAAQVSSRSMSVGLERVLVDFGADSLFWQSRSPEVRWQWLNK
jgi:hypothetical protein